MFHRSIIRTTAYPTMPPPLSETGEPRPLFLHHRHPQHRTGQLYIRNTGPTGRTCASLRQENRDIYLAAAL